MKILFLSKRRPQGRDLMTRPYGRFFHLPSLLAKRGCESYLLLLDYGREPPCEFVHQGVFMLSESILPRGPFPYIARANAIIREVKPDWIVGFSDTYYGILAEWLGRRHGIRSAIDAYDNYESYLPRLLPLHCQWRKAIAGAALVTAAGPDLAHYLGASRPQGSVHVVPMAADPIGFTPLDRAECRRRLALPEKRKIIGYCGSIHSSRGIETVFQAYRLLQAGSSDIGLLLSGRKERRLHIPSAARWLGYVDDDEVPFVLNALDVLLIPNRLSTFGRYSHPAKLYEAMSCRIPAVATETPATNWILSGRKQFLAPPDNPEELASKAQALLELGRYDYGRQNSWEESARLLEELFSA